jgi:hypothetical protein
MRATPQRILVNVAAGSKNAQPKRRARKSRPTPPRGAPNREFTRMNRAELARQVERYCADGHANEEDLTSSQAFPDDEW